MMRSMYAGVSGLKNHQTRMDVIGNNIANVNTAGYKKSRVVFKDTLYQSIRGASRPTGARGGTNPMGIGLGMTLASVDQIHTPSPTTVTNKLTDMAVDGNGYFMVSNGGERFYTRSGAFDFDKLGNLVMTSNGYYVQGWMADKENDYSIDTTNASGKIDISSYKNVEPKATKNMDFSGNLSSELPAMTLSAVPVPTDGYPQKEDCVITSKEIYDSLGNKHVLYFRFFKTDALGASIPASNENTSKWACDISTDPLFEKQANYDPATNASDFAVYDVGNPTTTPKFPGAKLVRAYNLQFSDKGEFPETLDAGAGNPPVQINSQMKLEFDCSSAGAQNMAITFDFKDLTQFSTKSTAWASYQDGYTMGNLTSYSVGTDGTIFGVYDNGESRNLARVGLANFENPAGLLQMGSNLYQVSNNSGDARIGAPGEQGMGAIIPGSLEMSNVDLSEEFTDMIVTQRGFQANSRIITTSDEMLQELVNLKR